MKDRGLVTLPQLVMLVVAENRRQIKRWGLADHTAGTWALILGEEVGETCEAMLEYKYNEDRDKEKLRIDVRDEAIQVATLALKIAEMYS